MIRTKVAMAIREGSVPVPTAGAPEIASLLWIFHGAFLVLPVPTHPGFLAPISEARAKSIHSRPRALAFSTEVTFDPYRVA